MSGTPRWPSAAPMALEAAGDSAHTLHGDLTPSAHTQRAAPPHKPPPLQARVTKTQEILHHREIFAAAFSSLASPPPDSITMLWVLM